MRIPSAPSHLAAVGLLEPEQHAHQGRLAGAVGPDERHDLALADIEVDAIQEDAAVARKAEPARGNERGGIEGSQTIGPALVLRLRRAALRAGHAVVVSVVMAARIRCGRDRSHILIGHRPSVLFRCAVAAQSGDLDEFYARLERGGA